MRPPQNSLFSSETPETKDLSSSTRFEDLPIFVKWMDFLKWLLHATDKFPKKSRYVFVNRLNAIALEIAESLVDARYSAKKGVILNEINLKLEKIRILLRISYESRLLPHEAYKHAMYALNEIGKMLGGWIRQQRVKS